MKIKVLIIEIGIKNIRFLRKSLDPKDVELAYASSFLDVVDTIHLENVHVIFLSDFRGINSTIGYIKMFKTTNPYYKVVILSTQKNVQEDMRSYYIQRGADSVVSCYDINAIEECLYNCYSKLFQDKQIMFEWSICTKKVIRFLKNNYHISYNLLTCICDNTNYSSSSIYHSVKKDTGVSVGEWIQKLRINGGMELLRSTEFSVESISNQVGYRSIQGFIKAFKKIVGKTPSSFRREQM